MEHGKYFGPINSDTDLFTMEHHIDIVDLISSLLDSEKYNEALSVPHKEKLVQSFKDNCWDLTSIIISKIQNDTVIIKPSLHGACEELLKLIVEKASPEEVLLEFIEQIEIAKNDAQFSIILIPLQQILIKLTVKRGQSLEWCLNSITTYIETIPIPEYSLEGKERLLMDSDDNIRRIIKVYSTIPPFYKPFKEELNAEDSNVRTKQIICAFLISLLGKPLIYIDLDPNSNLQSEARQACAIIIDDFCALEKDVVKFLAYIEVCSRESKISKPSTDTEDILPYDHREKINMMSLSGLFYIIFSTHFKIVDYAIPQVYSINYIVHTTLLSVNYLLCNTAYGPLTKGLSLCHALLDRFPNNAPHVILKLPVHFDLLKNLVNVAIYSSYEVIRKNSVNLIGKHINKFEYMGRCILINYLLKIANHSGMIGYAITLYKNIINEAFKSPQLDENFTGEQLMNMMRKICHLPHGAESDLVELADQIISALNFLRYLVIKDTSNQTGIKDHFTYIETEYLEKLRTGLNMSKAHYKVKLRDIAESQAKCDENINVSINIGALRKGKVLLPFSFIPLNNTQRIIRSYCQNSEVHKSEMLVSTMSSGNDDQQYEENLKDCILAKAMDFVPKTGWSVESLSQGAEAAGYPGITHGLFPNGGGDLVHYFNVKCNEQLVDQMKSWPKEHLKEARVPVQLVENAIMRRLLMIEPYKSTWPKAMAIQAIPNNVPNSLATLLSLVDDICYHSGDRSVDFNWYIRRVGLAGIYKASELFYLTDSSQESSASRNFVKSRIRDAELIQTALNMNPVSVAPQTLTAAFITAKNMLGLNTLK